MSEVLEPEVQAPAEPPSIRDTLTSAFSSDAAAPEPATPAPEPTDTTARDDKGRFAPKAEGVQAVATIPTPDQPVTPTPEAPQEPIRPPASWSAQAKADFAALAPHIQQEVLKRERDMDRGLEERANQLKKYEPLEQVIAPLRDRLAMNGQTPETYFSALAAADEALQGPNKLQALAQVAQMYGIDLRQFSQPGQPGQQPQQAQLPPEFGALMQEVQQLRQTVTQQQTAAQDASDAQLQAEIDAFSNANMYFENVRPMVAAILRAQPELDLKSAYDRACWADDSIRPHIMQERAAQEAEQARQAASAKVAAARGAGVSIAGSPVPGASAPNGAPTLSIRDNLAQAMNGSL